MKRLLCLLLVLLSNVCQAHPLGNTTINRLARLHAGPDELELEYLADFAEVPTLVASQDADSNDDTQTSSAEWAAYVRGWAERIASGIHLEFDGKPATLQLKEVRYALSDPSAPLPTLRIEAHFVAPAMPSHAQFGLYYEDRNDREVAGWRETTLDTRPGIRVLSASVPATDRSSGLTEFDIPLGGEAPNQSLAIATMEREISMASSRERSVLPDSVVPNAPSAGAQTGPESGTFADPSIKRYSRRPVTGASHASPHALPNQAPDGAAAIRIATAAPAQPVSQSASSDTHVISGGEQAAAFFRLGIQHIATGWDHLVFLCGLLLLSGSTRTLVKTVTAFTIAHSITLGLAAFGLVSAPGEVTEPAIALSVAYVGAMGLSARPHHGAWLAFGFGLIHGFGFAGVLAETMGESSAQLLSLMSFNLGIEAFQVLLVLITVPIFQWARAKPWAPMAWKIAYCAVVVTGLSWFVSRTVEVLA